MTPTLEQMKLAVAKMLPDKISILFPQREQKEFWWNEYNRGVNHTDWLHICWLAEQTLTKRQLHHYTQLITLPIWPLGWQSWMDTATLLIIPLEKKIAALCRVKNPEMFKP